MANEQEKGKIKYNTKNLDDIISMLKKDYRLRVGVIGSQAKQKNGKLTNAEIGTFHEQPNGAGCGHCPACKLRREGLEKYLASKEKTLESLKEADVE